MPKPIKDVPDPLRPFLFHGLQLDWEGRREAPCDCPSCGRGGNKFSVNVDTGEYKCFACDFSGGSTKFLRWLWDQSDKATRNSDYDAFAADRGLLCPETLMFWGACVSVLSGAWLFPGYNPDGALTQLYKRIWVQSDGRWELRPTPEVGGHAICGMNLYDPSATTVFIAEGPFDAMALWESLRFAKIGDGCLEFTGNPDTSLAAASSVLAVANCGAVGEPLRRYLPLFAGKRIVLCFDADHPKENNGATHDGAGFAATKRASAMLQGVASDVQWIRWGDLGFDPLLKDGWDVRDDLTVEAA